MDTQRSQNHRPVRVLVPLWEFNQVVARKALRRVGDSEKRERNQISAEELFKVAFFTLARKKPAGWALRNSSSWQMRG